jgi:hypothetical protein
MQDRIDEFWQLIRYVGLPSFAAVLIAFTLAAAARIAYRRYRGVTQQQGHPKRCDRYSCVTVTQILHDVRSTGEMPCAVRPASRRGTVGCESCLARFG